MSRGLKNLRDGSLPSSLPKKMETEPPDILGVAMIIAMPSSAHCDPSRLGVYEIGVSHVRLEGGELGS